MAKQRLFCAVFFLFMCACADPEPAPIDTTGTGDLSETPDVAGDEGPAPTDEGPAPTDEGPAPTDEGSQPVDEGSPAVDFGDFPTDEGAQPIDLGVPSIDVGPLPTDEGVEPTDLGSVPEDVPAPFEDLGTIDVFVPEDTQIPIQCEDPTQVIDCDENCIPMSFMMDDECQDGSIEFDGVLVNLKCSEFGCDSGACDGCDGFPPGECFDGQISDCDGNCVSSEWVGDGFCDDGLLSSANLNCEEHNFDGCDCPGPDCEIIPGECLIIGEIPDCDGVCFPSASLGDGLCDDGEGEDLFGLANFACEEFGCDSGDCFGCGGIPPGECIGGLVPDCDGNCANPEFLGDGFCDDGSAGEVFSPANFACEAYLCDGGDCGPLQCGGGCVPLIDCATVLDNFQCGFYPNGCGEICLTPGCSGGQVCNTDTGQCVDDCTADCSAIECGAFDDGCGGLCPIFECFEGDTCNDTGQCVSACVPECPSPASCAVLTDGCDGLCPQVECGPLEFCNEDLGQCQPSCIGSCTNECGTFDDGCGDVCVVPGCGEGDVCNEETGLCETEVEPAVGSAIISEYVEGSGGANKAIEIFNASSTDLDCIITKFVNGSIVGTPVGGLISLPVNELYVLCNSTSGVLNDDLCDDTNGGVSHNGDDAITVGCVPAGTSTADIELHDVLGVIGSDPGSAWTGGGLSTQNQTLRRDCGITQGDTNVLDDFDPSVGWTGFPQDTVNDLGHHCGFGTPPSCIPTCTNADGLPFQCGTFDDGCGAVCVVPGCGGGESCNEATGFCDPEIFPGPTWTGQVHSIFMGSCGGCHGASGGHSIGNSNAQTAYNSAIKTPNDFGNKCVEDTSVAACGLTRVQNGQMFGAQISPADQVTIQQWLDSGMNF